MADSAVHSRSNKLAVVVLAGGFGTRIRSRYADIPKALIPVAGRPFVEWIITSFRRQGVQYFVLATGHLGAVVDAYLARRPDDGVTVVAVHETQPLGTAGAVRHAAGVLPPVDTVAVTNGDSLVAADLTPAWRAMADPALDGILIGVPASDAARYGTLRASPDGRLLAFAEKRPGAGVINAGVYLLPRRMIDAIPGRVPLSLEYDVFPEWLQRGARFKVHVAAAPFLDIGTPESLDQADGFVKAAFP